MRDPKEIIDDFAKKRLERMLKDKSKEAILVIGSCVDYFGDGRKHKCEACPNIVLLKPICSDAVKKHDLTVICFECASAVPEIRKVMLSLANQAQQRITSEIRKGYVV